MATKKKTILIVEDEKAMMDTLGKKISKAKYCNSIFSKFKGLMFSNKLKKGRSIILVGNNLSLHMFFVFFPIDIVYLDSNKKVVEIRQAIPFLSFIRPKKKSKYVIEMNRGENVLKIGDKVELRSN